MPYTTYRNMLQALKNREDIKGSSVEAFTDNNGDYIIISYNTIMAVIGATEVKSFNDKYYSQTTSRLQNLIRQAFDIK